jgi:putative ABC transport system permease protein
MLMVLTIVLVALAVLNAICATWATALDATRTSAISRALGATTRQVGAGIAAAQLIPALPGALAGLPLGIALFAAASGGGHVVTIPSAWWLAATVVATLAVVAALASIPARLGARRAVAEVLRAEAS